MCWNEFGIGCSLPVVASCCVMWSMSFFPMYMNPSLPVFASCVVSRAKKLYALELCHCARNAMRYVLLGDSSPLEPDGELMAFLYHATRPAQGCYTCKVLLMPRGRARRARAQAATRPGPRRPPSAPETSRTLDKNSGNAIGTWIGQS